MASRIRYKDRNGILVSLQHYTSTEGIHTGQRFEARIDPTNHQWLILNVEWQKVIRNGDSPKNLNRIKDKIKNELIKLGVVFEKEILRDNTSRKPGINCAYKKE